MKLEQIRGVQTDELLQQLSGEYLRRLARVKAQMGDRYIGHPSRHIQRLAEPAASPPSEGGKYSPPTPWVSRFRWK